MKPGDTIRFVEGRDHRDTCPHCGGKVVAIASPPSVLHSVPVCSAYEAMDPLEFLEDMSARASGKTGDA